MFINGRYIVSACALLFFQQAMASGMDCTKAANAVEKTICADKGLYELDAQMGVVYERLMILAGKAQPELRSDQRQWLKIRNQCADVSCLEPIYRSRLQALQAQWIASITYQPDDVDTQVMEDLKRRIQDLRKHNPEFALERALDALAYSEDESGFSADLNEDEQPLFESFQSTAPSKRHKKTPADFSARGFPGHRLSQTSATNTSAMRILNAAPVSVGFTHEDDGMTLVPAINRFE